MTWRSCCLVYILADQELADSPSRKDGIDVETETTLRIYGAQMIQEAGILLKCPQAVMATGMILLQRFYCKRSLKEYSVKVRTPHVRIAHAKNVAHGLLACHYFVRRNWPRPPPTWPQNLRSAHASVSGTSSSCLTACAVVVRVLR